MAGLLEEVELQMESNNPEYPGVGIMSCEYDKKVNARVVSFLVQIREMEGVPSS